MSAYVCVFCRRLVDVLVIDPDLVPCVAMCVDCRARLDVVE